MKSLLRCRRSLLRLAWIWLAAVPLTGVAFPAEYYVAPDGDDRGPGSVDQPLRTLSRGVKVLRPGDTLWIRAGEYRESVVVQAEGTADQPITVAAVPGDEGKVVIKGSDVVREWTRQPGAPVWYTDWKTDLDSHYPENWEDFGPYVKRCEMVFADGKPLRQVLARGLLMRDTFFVDRDHGRLVIALSSFTKPKRVEVSVRQRGLFVRGRHLILRGLTVTHVANPHDEAAIEVRGSEITLEGNRAEWNNLDGFRLAGRNLKIIGNVANHNGRCGISASVRDSLLEKNITDENSWRFGPSWHAGGMKIVGGAPSGNRIRGHISRNNHSRGIWFDYGCRNNLVERCLLHGNLIAGLEFEACLEGNQAVNNVICHTRIWRGALTEHGTGAGILLYESYGTRIIHNTLVANEAYGVLIGGGGRTIHYDNSPAFSAKTDIFNNIIALNGTAGLGFWVWSKSAEPEAVSSHRCDYNLWWQPKSPIALLPAQPKAAERPKAATLKEWRALTGYGEHSLVADPHFVDAEGCDYHLGPDSPALDRAQLLPDVTVDAESVPRPQGTGADLGAYELR